MASPPAEVAASAGTILPLSVASAAAATKKIRPNSTMRLVRPDYHRKPLLTYAEAAQEAGLSVARIANLVCKGKLPVARRVGAFRIDRMELDRYLRSE